MGMPCTSTVLAVPAVIVMALCVAQGPAGARDASLAAARGQPAEVTMFLRRRSNCGRLAGEDGDDPEHVAATVKSRFWMKCSTVEDDERRLRARYADRPTVLEALDQGGESGDTDN